MTDAEQQYKFTEALSLFHSDKAQEAVDIFYLLAEDGHTESLVRLADIFLDQNDYDVVDRLLNNFPLQNHPTLLHLKAKLTEQSQSIDFNLYAKAAEAGSHDSVFTLVERFISLDQRQAKKWFVVAKKMNNPHLQYLSDLFNFKAREKKYQIVVVNSDTTNVYLEINLQLYGTNQTVDSYASLEPAVEYCISEDAGFEILHVNESWEMLDPAIDMHVKVHSDRPSIRIAQGYEDYWFGDSSDLEAAVVGLINADVNGDLVFYDSIPIVEEKLDATESEKLSLIRPVYFALASSDWMRTRYSIHEKDEDGETWENFLAEEDLSPEQFDRYENFWISPAGMNLVSDLSMQFADSIYETASVGSLKMLEEFFQNHAVWSDFIRELCDCTPADVNSNGADRSYFAEYAIGGGLCYSESDQKDFDEELITDEVEDWFSKSYWDAQRILLSAYDEVSKIL